MPWFKKDTVYPKTAAHEVRVYIFLRVIGQSCFGGGV